MLPASERLRRDSVFQRTYAARKSIATPLITLYVLPRRRESSPRLPLVGFVVGKKVHADAAKRNAVKRKMREAYRLQRQQTPGLKQWYSMVFVAHSKIVGAGFAEISRIVGQVMAAAGQRYGREGSPLLPRPAAGGQRKGGGEDGP